MEPLQAKPSKSLATYLNEGEPFTWANRQQLWDMFGQLLAPRKVMAILTAVIVGLIASFDLFTLVHGPAPVAIPLLDALVGPALNMLFKSNEYASFPGCFFGYIEPLLQLALAFLAVYWVLALLRHEVKSFASWKEAKAA